MQKTCLRFRISIPAAAVVLTSALTANAAPPTADVGSTAAERLLSDAPLNTECRQNRGTRAWLRQKFVRDCDIEKYGLPFDDDWQTADVGKPVIVLIHGFNSTPQQNAALMVPIRNAGFPCGTFAYPNDYILRNSAQLLSGELRRFKRENPHRRVYLVCHSMGGLVARACLEDSLYDPGNVDRLIMIAPPTHGTVIAHFAVGTDLYEHWIARTKGWPLQRNARLGCRWNGRSRRRPLPAIRIFAELNARPLNPRIRYSVLLGTGARLSESQVAWIRESVCDSLAKLPGGGGSAAHLDALLADIDEIVQGKGDGVVAVKRGRLDGVADTLVLPFGHIAVTAEPKDRVLVTVQSAVLERVRSALQKPRRPSKSNVVGSGTTPPTCNSTEPPAPTPMLSSPDTIGQDCSAKQRNPPRQQRHPNCRPH